MTSQRAKRKLTSYGIAAIVGALMMLVGCWTPPAGYDQDLTPGHNGEVWISSVEGNKARAAARSVMSSYIKHYPLCAVCKTNADVEVHHIVPISVDTKLAADKSNMISLCRKHHFIVGHNANWRSYNLGVTNYLERK